ncbi:MAG: GNAT family N-acetyltransferase, partial [Bacteroidota bacterium]
MGSRILPERQLPPEQLDHYLALGYRVAGQAIYTSEYIKLGLDSLVSVLPTRLPLSDLSLSRNLRKCKRKNQARFTASVGPARLDMHEEQVLNRRYLYEKPEKAVQDLGFHVFGRRVIAPLLRTWQTRVYDGKRLVATSYFDLGMEGAYSKQGIYDPAYSKYSLGLYTLILEMEFCRWAGKRWFYPGYIGVETDLFDYKLKLSDTMSYFDFRSQQWLPFAGKENLPKPLEDMQNKLEELSRYLATMGIPSRVRRYLYGDVRYSLRLEADHYLDGPYLLELLVGARPMVVTYELTGTHPFGLL